MSTSRCALSLLLAGLAMLRGAAHDIELSPAGIETPGRARVVIVSQPGATSAFKADAEKVQAMVRTGIRKLTGKEDLGAAWLSLVSTQDTVGIKIHSAPGPLSGTRPAVVEAVVRDLLAAGVPSKQVILWDRRLSDLKRAGFVELAEKLGVRAAGSTDSGWDGTQSYDNPLLGRLVWGDHEFGKKGEGIGRKSFVSSLVTKEMTRIISITPLLNHNLAGVSGNLYGLAMDSVDNTLRFEGQPELLARAVPEIVALPCIGDRVALNIVDALVCQYQGEETMLLHYSAVLNQLRFSRDPVALDVLSVQELKRQREAVQAPPLRMSGELFENASLVEIGVSDPARIQIEPVP
jgi:hypothetical protein